MYSAKVKQAVGIILFKIAFKFESFNGNAIKTIYYTLCKSEASDEKDFYERRLLLN